MAVGQLRCQVINVNDLDVAEKFWSEVTGLSLLSSGYCGRFSYLGQTDPWRHEIILQLSASTKGPEANRSHIDITVADVDLAVSQVEAIGGRLKKEPSLFPRPHSHEGKPPVIDWAVMQDPFGNEFCLVSELTADEGQAVIDAGIEGHGGDQHWRVVAGRAK